MTNGVEIVPLSPSRPVEVRRFIRVAYRIYRDDPHWVAPLESELSCVLGPANPFYQHAEMQLWVARRDGRDVGRIAALEDRAHNAIHGGRTAMFGFLESPDDVCVSEALLGTAAAWASQRGLNQLLGPMNPSINDECGLLIEGFDSAPALMMPYNPSYLPGLVEAAGFAKAKDLHAFQIDVAQSPRERLERLSSGIQRRQKELRIHAVTPRSLAADVPVIKRVYNEAWDHNWNAVPLTDGEIDFLVARLKPLLVEGLVWLAEHGGQPAGFMLAVPDFNEALKPLRGRLLSPGLLRALPLLAGWRRPRRMRLIALGVQERFRGRGIEAVMFAETLKRCFALGFLECEASWILEDNLPVRQLIELFSGRCYKKYRLYERGLS